MKTRCTNRYTKRPVTTILHYKTFFVKSNPQNLIILQPSKKSANPYNPPTPHQKPPNPLKRTIQLVTSSVIRLAVRRLRVIINQSCIRVAFAIKIFAVVSVFAVIEKQKLAQMDWREAVFRVALERGLAGAAGLKCSLEVVVIIIFIIGFGEKIQFLHGNFFVGQKETKPRRHNYGDHRCHDAKNNYHARTIG